MNTWYKTVDSLLSNTIDSGFNCTILREKAEHKRCWTFSFNYFDFFISLGYVKKWFWTKEPQKSTIIHVYLTMCVACIRTCMKQDTTFIKMFFYFEHKSNFCFSLNPRYDSFGQNTFTKWIIVFVKRNNFEIAKKLKTLHKLCFYCDWSVFRVRNPKQKNIITNTILYGPYGLHMWGQRTE